MNLGNLFHRIFAYNPPDPIDYWQTRAASEGWSSVMWRNNTYNELADRDQWRVIESNLPKQRGRVLDLGCGSGRMSARLAGCFDEYVGVDLDAMVAEAHRRNPNLATKFVGASVQEYAYPADHFDMVLSLACLAAACKAEELPDIARRIARATRTGGKIIIIEPFHRLPPLTRLCEVSHREVVDHFRKTGVSVDKVSGMLFIPLRLLLTRPQFSNHPTFTRISYHMGETMRRIAPHLLSDYRVMTFTKR